ncbi:MAG: aspartate--tRNA(Asn) ligase [Candidatus Aenigmarchaeota archaeon]|nr:aspartate--tRNA(Asn) ligase [Candidatus Aenigmarchaeota archaeon]
MLRTHYSSEIQPEMSGKKVTVAGWARNIREHGGLMFLIVADNSGEMQVTAKKGAVSNAVIQELSAVSKEDAISVTGVVKKNEIAPGKREIIPEKIIILGKAESPLPLDLKVKSNLDTRLDWRFLDLRKPEVRAIFRIKDVVQRSFVRYLEENGFILVNTPQIVAAATEGGANLFPISYFDREAFLGQSPQLYKQMLMASGLDKVIIVVPVFRAEEHDTSFHLNEATQMDIEMAFVSDEQDALKYMDGVISYIYSRVGEECKNELELLERNISVPKSVKQLTYDDALKLVKDKIKIKWGDDLTPEAQRVICSHYNPVIVTKWPTDIRAFYAMPEPGNEKICRAYDMLIDGIEVCSGAQRIHDHDKLVKEMLRRKMNPKNFEFYLNAFRYGMPPHAGWSFGLERLTMAITGAKNIRECVLFPRDRKRLMP